MITPPSVSEADVRLAATGDRSAYERLVRRCAGLVTAVALSVVRDVERSEDIAQEMFVAAWKDLSKLRNPPRMSGPAWPISWRAQSEPECWRRR